MQPGKVQVESQEGKVLEGMKGVRAKGSYAEVVVGKRQEDERRNPAKSSMETPFLLAGNIIAG
jgi:hypothetical protein